MARLIIELLPAFSDNYIYLLREPEAGAVGVVDPGTADPVIKALEQRGWGLDLILATHHHGDHIGGAEELKRRYGAPLVGPLAERSRISGMDRMVVEGDTVALGGQVATVLETPGHTKGHIAYWFEDSRALFCGDTLFALGCGRLFEGTPEQMWASLTKLRNLPGDTRIYCGHEYTQSNCNFALTVDPGNAELAARAQRIVDARRQGQPTLPAELAEEKRTNPFLRADDPDLQAALRLAGADPVAVFAEVRMRKDIF